jgi:nitroreductase
MLRDLLRQARSYRRFDQSQPIDRQTLEELIELTTLTSSSGNLQPLRYVLSSDAQDNEKIFSHIAWAGYLTDWPGPEPDERPTGYIVILADTKACHAVNCDHGIAAQTIMLGAAEKGFGCCVIGAIQRDRLREALDLPARYKVLLVVALGKPSETVELETVGDDGDIKYWRDQQGTMHVPKRRKDDIIIQ